MKRYGQLFGDVTGTSNLWSAWLEFRRGKRRRPSVRAFELDADREVFQMHRQIAAGDWRPEPFRLKVVREPKRRLIAAAPVRDRVMHHACVRVLAPLLDGGLVAHTYACLPGRGSHRALLAFQSAQRRYRQLLHLDVRHYFLSIDRGILLELMACRIKDPLLLALLQRIAEGGHGLYQAAEVRALLGLEPGFPPRGCGLPIGNLTSQWWGNHYLSGLDHFVKRELKIPHAQRYMDDVTLFSDSRSQLEEAREAISDWLWQARRLRLKKPAAAVQSTRRLHVPNRTARSGCRAVGPSPGRR